MKIETKLQYTFFDVHEKQSAAAKTTALWILAYYLTDFNEIFEFSVTVPREHPFVPSLPPASSRRCNHSPDNPRSCRTSAPWMSV